MGIIILLALMGFGAAGWNHMGPWFNQWNNDNGDFFNAFGMPEHDNEQQALTAEIPANSSVQIENPRGDVSVTSGDGLNVEVQAHQVAFANSDADAKKIFDAEAAQMKVSGNAVLIKSEGNNNGRVNLTITVPKTRTRNAERRQGRCDSGRIGRRPERELGARRDASELDYRFGAGAFHGRQT